MTQTNLDEILALPSIEEIIDALSVSSFDIPSWSDLEKQYDPNEHSIMTDLVKYPLKLDENSNDEFKRTPLALQKLLVNRISQSMFATPVERIYSYDADSDSQKQAIEVIEQVYRTDNYIDDENIDRAKMVNASCQMATIWSVYDDIKKVKGFDTKFSLSHASYSEMDGYSIYANIDDNRKLLVVSIGYTDTSEVDHFDVYVNGTNPQYIAYEKPEDEWIINTDKSNSQLSPYPVVYTHIKEPVWGGDAGTNKIEQIEEMESFDGLYIKKNSSPFWVLDMGEVDGERKETNELADASRKVLEVGRNGSMTDGSWSGAGDAVNKRIDRLRNSIFEESQVPDTSFANMIKSNTSAENKELIFADAKAKAMDLGGAWQKLFLEEMQIVIDFAKIMFPSLTSDLEFISVRSRLKPYSVKSRKENGEYVATAGQYMSTETAVKVLNEVDDIDAEVEKIDNQLSASINQGEVIPEI